MPPTFFCNRQGLVLKSWIARAKGLFFVCKITPIGLRFVFCISKSNGRRHRQRQAPLLSCRHLGAGCSALCLLRENFQNVFAAVFSECHFCGARSYNVPQLQRPQRKKTPQGAFFITVSPQRFSNRPSPAQTAGHFSAATDRELHQDRKSVV